MKWSFVIILPAVVAILWALATLLLKRSCTRAQLLLSLAQLLLAFANIDLLVFFRGTAGRLFIYDFLFETTALLFGPLLYIGFCSLVEPRGATLRQRHSFILPLLFIVGLVVGAFWLGPRRYDQLCYAIREGNAAFIPGDSAWNFLLFWDHILFPTLLLPLSFLLLLMATNKVRSYQRRFNSYYARGLNLPFIDSRHLILVTWLFLPITVALVLLVNLRPFYYKYWLIGCSLILAVLLFLLGRFIFRLDSDARTLADFIRHKQ
ncbi:MAG: hypothetical protein IJ634_03640 [Bacteroidales bacterium]|nr:hypothetical protein [Bacteroidales bacterium]